MKATAIFVAVTVVSLCAAGVWIFSHQFKPVALTSRELVLRQGEVRPPEVRDCSDLRRDYKRLTSSRRVLDKRPPRNAGALSQDEIAIYRAVLQQWTAGEKTPLHVALQTYPLGVFSETNDTSCDCLGNIDAETLVSVSRSFHNLTRNVLPRRNMRLIDTAEGRHEVAENDPDYTMRAGMPVDAAVTNAFKNGLFSLSEIAFDRERRHALVSYSFGCGMLCGSGMTIVFEKVGDEWQRTELQCGGWVS